MKIHQENSHNFSKPRGTTALVFVVVIAFVCVLSLLNVSSVLGGSGSLLSEIESRYSRAVQTDVEFLHIVVSEFFETADTVSGSITFDPDGRYHTTLEQDEYIFDGECLWVYSGVYGQATRNCLKTGQRIEDSFLFFTRFSEYYTIRETVADSLYHLAIISERKGSAPDSLTVEVSQNEKRIVTLQYFDINDELNIVLLLSETFPEVADSLAYSASFPDSTEVIEIHD